jgi:hypothetical protein
VRVSRCVTSVVTAINTPLKYEESGKSATPMTCSMMTTPLLSTSLSNTAVINDTRSSPPSRLPFPLPTSAAHFYMFIDIHVFHRGADDMFTYITYSTEEQSEGRLSLSSPREI